MKFRGLVIPGMAAILAAVAFATAAQPSGTGRASRSAVSPPSVVVELFTAQGCPGCPEANRVAETLSQEPGVIALTYAVDYWDYLGWPDTFARPEFAQRQNDYREALKLRNVYTPQMVIDGHRQIPGGVEPDVQEAVDAAVAERRPPPQIEFRASGDYVGVGSGRVPIGGAEVWAVTYTPGTQMVTVAQGDNRGQTVRHINVVRSLQKLGDWNGRPVLYPLPPELEAGDGVAVLLQARLDRRILNGATQ